MKSLKTSPLFVFTYIFTNIFTLFLFCSVAQAQEILNKSVSKPGEIVLPDNRLVKSIYASDNDSNIYISDNQGILYSYELKTLQQNWATDLGGEISAIFIDDLNELLLALSTNQTNPRVFDSHAVTYIKSISKKTGIPTNSTEVKTAEKTYIFKNKENILALSGNSCISAYIDKQLTEIKCFEKETSLKPFFDRQRGELFIVSRNDLIKIPLKDVATGNRILQSGTEITSFSMDKDSIFIGDQKGNLQAFERKSMNSLWSFRSGGEISDIFIDGEFVVVASYDGFLYSFESRKGKRIWKKRFPGRIEKITPSGKSLIIVRTGYSADLFILDIAGGDISDIIYVSAEDAATLDPIDTKDYLIIPKKKSLDIYRKEKE